MEYEIEVRDEAHRSGDPAGKRSVQRGERAEEPEPPEHHQVPRRLRAQPHHLPRDGVRAERRPAQVRQVLQERQPVPRGKQGKPVMPYP